MNQSTNLAKTKWACRRGMLELDYIFNDFLRLGYGKLSEQQQLDFMRFLENADPDLYSWLMGFRQPTEDDDIIMVKLVLELIKEK